MDFHHKVRYLSPRAPEHSDQEPSVPITAVAFGFALVGYPRYFPFQGFPEHKLNSLTKVFSKSTRSRLDIPGAGLMLCAVVLLTAAFQEAGSAFEWRSAYVISMIVISGILWSALLMWERRVTRQESVREPVLPWRFFTNRIMFGVLLYVPQALLLHE